MARVARLVVAAVLLLVGGPASALELGLDAAPGGAAAPDGRDLAPTLRSLTAELARWEKETIGHEVPSLAIEIDRGSPYRLSLEVDDGRLRVVAGRAFVRDPVLFRALASFVLGLSRYDRYGQERWIERLGLGDRTVWKHYFGARHLAEVVYNADQGSPLAQADVAEFWQAHLDAALAADGEHAALAAMRSAQAARLIDLEPACAAARTLEKRLVGRVQRKVADLRKRGVDLEKLVRADRRDQVADALESVVPLGDLEPFERAFWRQQLDLMRAPSGRRIALHRALYSGEGYRDGAVILSPIARDAVEGGKPAADAVVSYFRVRTARGQAWQGHPGIFRNFKALEKKHTSIAINAMLANQADSSSSSPFISFGDREFAEDFAGRRRGERRARVRAYDVAADQILIASHARWNEPEMMKFLFLFPSDRHAKGTRAPSETEVHAIRSRFNGKTIGTRKGVTRRAQTRARR
jgi:hypothetical protein